MVASIQLTIPFPVNNVWILQENQKKIVFWHIAYRYYGYGAPYCFSGFFSRLEAGTSNVVV